MSSRLLVFYVDSRILCGTLTLLRNLLSEAFCKGEGLSRVWFAQTSAKILARMISYLTLYPQAGSCRDGLRPSKLLLLLLI